jgi:hypothetical protein
MHVCTLYPQSGRFGRGVFGFERLFSGFSSFFWTIESQETNVIGLGQNQGVPPRHLRADTARL